MPAPLAVLLFITLQQAPDPPPQYVAALDRLSAHDTADAITLLREATRRAPRFGPGFLRLGSLLSAIAGEVPSEFRERVEAERALRRANQLLGDDPEVLLEFGLLLRKQQAQIDARRVLERAARAAAKAGETLPPAQRARINYALGLIYESWWEDWEQLIDIKREFMTTLRCPRLDSALIGPPMEVLGLGLTACPEKWGEMRSVGAALSDLKGAERQQMLWHFREAFRADSTQVDAALHLMMHLAEDAEWDAYDEVARRLVALRPDDPRAHLFLGLGEHERNRDSVAERDMGRGIGLLAAGDRRAFDDIGPLLPPGARRDYATADSGRRAATARVFFAATDPLFLTGTDDRRLEHYARLAWADLKFGSADAGKRGWDTDRGAIWVRYGPPRDWFQCCYGAGSRRIFWSYGEHGPVFVFKKELTVQNARFTDAARFLADEMAATSPQTYQPRTVTTIVPEAYQLARFRGSHAGDTRVEIYALPPVDALADSTVTRFESGVFVFDRYYQPMWSGRQQLRRGEAAAGVNYRFEVGPGVYRVGVESRADGPPSQARPAARARDSVAVTGFPPGRLGISDLLLLDSLTPLVDNPRRREDFHLTPSRTLALAEGAPVLLYYELYGLGTDTDRVARYTVEVTVEDSTHRAGIAGVARGLAQLFVGSTSQGTVTFSRVTMPDSVRTVDYLTVQLGDLGPGEYAVYLRVRDDVTGETAFTRRRFRVLRPS